MRIPFVRLYLYKNLFVHFADKGNPNWVATEVTVTSGDQVMLKAVKGGDAGQPFGDIAIDSLVITTGDCSNRNAGRICVNKCISRTSTKLQFGKGPKRLHYMLI